MVAKLLSWFALISTAAFGCLAIGRSLHTKLLAIPLIALAISQILRRN